MQRLLASQSVRWIIPIAIVCVGGVAAWAWMSGLPVSKAAAGDSTRGTASAVEAMPPTVHPPVDKRELPMVPVVVLASDAELAPSPDALDEHPDADTTRDEVLTPAGQMLQLKPTSNPTSAATSAPERRVEPPTSRPAPSPTNPPSSGSGTELRRAVQKLQAGQLLDARGELSRLLSVNPNGPDAIELRKHLAKLAEDTIFGKKEIGDDPLVEMYKVAPGDKLIQIGKTYGVPSDVLMMVNGIASANKLAAGQTIKVLNGPFNAVISKSAYRLDLYLQDTYVRSFNVGLGQENGTPTGKWRVTGRLKKPTYYPPPSAKEKKIIKPDDPRNPLGGFWVALEGVEGEAVGKKSFGIHGTIEPESIGKDASMGCVRMLNEDAEFVFRVMMPERSMVTILP
ncbi:MAG: L,D-transpeptidase family protein [Phycisphaerae bacterium]